MVNAAEKRILLGVEKSLGLPISEDGAGDGREFGLEKERR
jgi:hypothetical protein